MGTVVLSAEVHDHAFLHVEGHSPDSGPFGQLIQAVLQQLPVTVITLHLPQLRVVCKLLHCCQQRCLDVQVVDKYQEQDWSKN